MYYHGSCFGSDGIVQASGQDTEAIDGQWIPLPHHTNSNSCLQLSPSKGARGKVQDDGRFENKSIKSAIDEVSLSVYPVC